MKLRNGFVSNSSSSSFIVSFAEGSICSHCGRGDYSFLNFLRQSSDSETCLLAETTSEVLAYINDSYSEYADQEQIKKALDLVDSAAREGRKVIVCDISYHDQRARELLDSAGITYLYLDG